MDRLLLGMKLCLKAGESDPLFTDPLFTRSKTWTISTSHLAHEYAHFVGLWGWGKQVGTRKGHCFSESTPLIGNNRTMFTMFLILLLF